MLISPDSTSNDFMTSTNYCHLPGKKLIARKSHKKIVVQASKGHSKNNDDSSIKISMQAPKVFA